MFKYKKSLKISFKIQFYFDKILNIFYLKNFPYIFHILNFCHIAKPDDAVNQLLAKVFGVNTHLSDFF